MSATLAAAGGDPTELTAAELRQLLYFWEDEQNRIVTFSAPTDGPDGGLCGPMIAQVADILARYAVLARIAEPFRIARYTDGLLSSMDERGLKDLWPAASDLARETEIHTDAKETREEDRRAQGSPPSPAELKSRAVDFVLQHGENLRDAGRWLREYYGRQAWELERSAIEEIRGERPSGFERNRMNLIWAAADRALKELQVCALTPEWAARIMVITWILADDQADTRGLHLTEPPASDNDDAGFEGWPWTLGDTPHAPDSVYGRQHAGEAIFEHIGPDWWAHLGRALGLLSDGSDGEERQPDANRPPRRVIKRGPTWTNPLKKKDVCEALDVADMRSVKMLQKAGLLVFHKVDIHIVQIDLASLDNETWTEKLGKLEPCSPYRFPPSTQ